MIERLLSPNLVDALGWTLIHSLWQGALFALLLGVVLITLRAYSAQARYLVSVGFLLAFFVAVGLTFGSQYSASDTVVEFSSTTAPETPTPSNDDGPSAQSDRATTTERAVERPAATVALPGTAYFQRHLPLIVTLWLMGVLVLQLRFLGQLVYVQRLKSYATQNFPEEWTARLRDLEQRLGIGRKVRYLTSARVNGAFTTGWLRPVVMLPAGLLQELREAQLLAILAHELAHVKRHDFAVNLLQTLLSTFFFYHPGVWWMSARIHDEREHCCDDLAVGATGERIDYARTLVQLREKELITPKLSMAIGGVGFGGRIRRLLSGYLGTATFGEGVVTTLILGATLSLAMATSPKASDSSLTVTAPARPGQTFRTQSGSPPAPVFTKRELQDRIGSIVVEELDKEGLTDPRNYDEQAPTDEFGMLMRAIYDGDTERFNYLVEKVDDLGRLDRHGFTPLMAAASEDEVEIARVLIDRGVDVNQLSSENGWTALIEAADEGSFEVARLLIQNGAQVDLKGPNAYRNALDMAASEGHADMIQLLLGSGANKANSHALHLAANEGEADVVRLLLDEGFAVDARDEGGRTPLMHAASEGNTEVVRILLAAGADREAVDEQGFSAMIYAAEEGATPSLQVMTDGMAEAAIKHLQSSPEILLGPAREGDLFTVQAMLETGIDIDIADEEGNTALSMAAREGHVDVVRYLLGRGARVQSSSGGQCSPVFLAAREDHPEVVRLLVGKGASLEDGCNFREVDYYGETTVVSIYAGAPPLTVAIQEGHTETVATLLRLGSDVNQTLHKESYTVSGLDWSTVSALSPSQLKARSTTHYLTDGWTPLLEAVETNNKDAVGLLLRAGARIDHASSDGTTALRLSQQLGHSAITEILE